MRFAGLKSGDIVVITGVTSSYRREVSKIGRKWFRVLGSTQEFRLDDGMPKSGYSWPRAQTIAGYEEDTRLNIAQRALFSIGVQIDIYMQGRNERTFEVYEVLRPLIQRLQEK